MKLVVNLTRSDARRGEIAFATEAYEYLVGSAVFNTVGTSDPRSAGSIPVRLRHWSIGPSAQVSPRKLRTRDADIPHSLGEAKGVGADHER